MADPSGMPSRLPIEIAESGSPDAGPSRARRRLLLGAAALPSVFTLTSGAATAATSALNNLATTPPPYNLSRFTMSSDGWLRKRVYVGKLGTDTADCVTWNQPSCVNPLSPDKAADGSVWIHKGTRVVAGPGTKITKLTTGPEAYGLVYVDTKGTITTLDPNGNTELYPCTVSVWASIAVSSTSLLG